MNIELRPLQIDELDRLIEFDKINLCDIMREIGVPENKCTPSITQAELLAAMDRGDILSWIFVDDQLAGYIWGEKQADCLFGAGAALMKEFYGLGLIDYLIVNGEKLARELSLSICRLAVVPMNGRVINAHLRHGYQVVGYVDAFWGPDRPDTFRCIMEKNLDRSEVRKEVLDRCETRCTDEDKLRELFDKGYVGVGYHRASNGNAAENKILLELHAPVIL